MRWSIGGLRRRTTMDGPSHVVPAHLQRVTGTWRPELLPAIRRLHRSVPKRWVGFRRSPKRARKPERVNSTGGHAEQASNTARGTPVNRHSVINASLCTLQKDVHRVMGRLAPRRSAHPRFRRARTSSTTGAPAARQTIGRRSVGCATDQRSHDKFGVHAEPRAPSLPLVGRVDRRA